MKILADEHVSPKIVRAVGDIALKPGWTLEAVRGSSYQGKADEDWVSLFVRDSGRAVLSADRRMLKRPTMIQKITQTGLIALFLPQDWAESRRHYQAAHILYWWPKIEAVIEGSNNGRGQAWIIPKGLARGELRLYVEKTKSASNTVSSKN